ncbi:MAG: hypothetical protein HY961_00040 [Ignavibacteriae bacterium]|nr:hypothetical protein [Ignavibacteriota bacterium]
MKFIVAANYEDGDLLRMKEIFRDKAIFIDERIYGKGGMIKAYNLAFFLAKELRFEYVALWADDIMPRKADWHKEINGIIASHDFDFGVFSTDECHKHVFGWNFFHEIPNAHFFIAKSRALGDFFLNPCLNAYVGDYEVCVRLIANGTKLTLLPIKLNHYPMQNEGREKNTQFYQYDLNMFNALCPNLRGVMDEVVLVGNYSTNGKFILDTGELLESDTYSRHFISYEELMAHQETSTVGVLS